MKKLLVVIVALAVLGAGTVALWQRSSQPPVGFRTTPVKRGDLLVTISATGTVEPVEVIDVGAQVAGKIESFGRDPHDDSKTIDYGTQVEKGTVLAHIDDSLYAADVAQAAAMLEQAKANVLRDQADLEQMKAKLFQAEQNWKRAQELGPSKALSATDYDSYRAAYETAQATVGVGDATIVQAQKAVAQAEASLERSKTNLGYCTIRSPVKGVIIDRRVNIGQTVVASLNAPSLFLIAKDLTKMQVWASVNEADIGSIHPGQPVSFTVDAYPGRTFRGEVGKIRLNASMTQNVVTYTVEINTDNSDGKLLPYLTANVDFEVALHKDVLMVANSALRWMPATQQIAPDARDEFTGAPRRKPAAGVLAGASGSDHSGADRSASRRAADQTDQPRGKPGTLWIEDGTYVRPVPVTTGLTDGAVTEIQTDKLAPGAEVVFGEAAQASGERTASPFTPQIFRNRNRQE
jgi:HlyD family secretion protein